MSDKNKALISKHISSSLNTVPFHKDVGSIKRFVPEGFPIHMAIHEVSQTSTLDEDYCDSHVHSFPELNLILGEPGALVYKIQLGDEIHEVESPASIWIPPYLEHSANVIRGKGYFIAIRLSL
jgi:hypothetical protein